VATSKQFESLCSKKGNVARANSIFGAAFKPLARAMMERLKLRSRMSVCELCTKPTGTSRRRRHNMVRAGDDAGQLSFPEMDRMVRDSIR